MIDAFFGSIGFWWRGWRFLFRHPSLLMIALMPIFISFLAVAASLWFVYSYIPAWARDITLWFLGNTSDFWHGLLYYPLLVGGSLVLTIGTIYVIYLAYGLIAIPFFSLLVERTLERLNKKPDRKLSWGAWLRLTLYMLRVGILKSVLFLVLGGICFLASFIPVVNFFALFGLMMILAFDCMDYSFEAMGWGLRRRLRYMRQHRWQWLGMATGLALTLIIPGLTLLLIPGAIVGGAMNINPDSEGF